MQKHEEWLVFAENDLKVAKIIINADEIILGPVLYHVQQCAEKSLKAYLIFKKCALKRTHDLVALVNICSKIDSDFSVLLIDAVDLNPYATAGRYPDDFFMPDVTTAKININKAQNFLDFVRNKIY